MYYIIFFLFYITFVVNANPLSSNSLVDISTKPSLNIIINPINHMINNPNINIIIDPGIFNNNFNLIISSSNHITIPSSNHITIPSSNHITIPSSNLLSPNIVEKSAVTQYDNKLIEEYDRLIRSDEVMYHFRWQVLSDVVKRIRNDKETLELMLKRDSDGFGYVYDEHYIRNKKLFSLFSSKDDSFCASLVMGKYH